jgi:hypothetical protein
MHLFILARSLPQSVGEVEDDELAHELEQQTADAVFLKEIRAQTNRFTSGLIAAAMVSHARAKWVQAQRLYHSLRMITSVNFGGLGMQKRREPALQDFLPGRFASAQAFFSHDTLAPLEQLNARTLETIVAHRPSRRSTVAQMGDQFAAQLARAPPPVTGAFSAAVVTKIASAQTALALEINAETDAEAETERAALLERSRRRHRRARWPHPLTDAQRAQIKRQRAARREARLEAVARATLPEQVRAAVDEAHNPYGPSGGGDRDDERDDDEMDKRRSLHLALKAEAAAAAATDESASITSSPAVESHDGSAVIHSGAIDGGGHSAVAADRSGRRALSISISFARIPSTGGDTRPGNLGDQPDSGGVITSRPVGGDADAAAEPSASLSARAVEEAVGDEAIADDGYDSNESDTQSYMRDNDDADDDVDDDDGDHCGSDEDDSARAASPSASPCASPRFKMSGFGNRRIDHADASADQRKHDSLKTAQFLFKSTAPMFSRQKTAEAAFKVATIGESGSLDAAADSGLVVPVAADDLVYAYRQEDDALNPYRELHSGGFAVARSIFQSRPIGFAWIPLLPILKPINLPSTQATLELQAAIQLVSDVDRNADEDDEDGGDRDALATVGPFVLPAADADACMDAVDARAFCAEKDREFQQQQIAAGNGGSALGSGAVSIAAAMRRQMKFHRDSFAAWPGAPVLTALSDAVLLRLASLARLCVALLPPIECAAALAVAEPLRFALICGGVAADEASRTMGSQPIIEILFCSQKQRYQTLVRASGDLNYRPRCVAKPVCTSVFANV